MPTITVLPHEDLCPQGSVFEAPPGIRLCDALLRADIDIEHACEKSCVCTSCHVIIRGGFNTLRPATDDEEDQLGKAWGLEPHSRLSCQVVLNHTDLQVEIPRYTLNVVSEHS